MKKNSYWVTWTPTAGGQLQRTVVKAIGMEDAWAQSRLTLPDGAVILEVSPKRFSFGALVALRGLGER